MKRSEKLARRKVVAAGRVTWAYEEGLIPIGERDLKLGAVEAATSLGMMKIVDTFTYAQ